MVCNGHKWSLFQWINALHSPNIYTMRVIPNFGNFYSIWVFLFKDTILLCEWHVTPFREKAPTGTTPEDMENWFGLTLAMTLCQVRVMISGVMRHRVIDSCHLPPAFGVHYGMPHNQYCLACFWQINWWSVSAWSWLPVQCIINAFIVSRIKLVSPSYFLLLDEIMLGWRLTTLWTEFLIRPKSRESPKELWWNS